MQSCSLQTARGFQIAWNIYKSLYCTTEAFVSGLGLALAGFLLHNDSQEMDKAEVEQMLTW